MENKELLQKLLGGAVKEDVSLAQYTTFKVGGNADLFYEANSKEDLIKAVIQARSLGLPVFVLGGGTNILIGDKGIRGLVVKNNTSQIVIRGMKGHLRKGQASGLVFVEADSGVNFNKLVRFTIEEELAGIEMHLGLPGTVGGAIYMNSKWTDPQAYVGDAVYQATILTPNNDVRVVPQAYFHFGYDASTIQRTHDIVLSVVFALRKENKAKLWETANQSVVYRRESQPQGVRSAGCTFKNITQAQALTLPTPNNTTSAGFLIDHAGLKGLTIGRVRASPVHANFIINLGGAKARDVVELIDTIKEKVKQKYGVMLKEEIVRVGEF